MDASAAVEPQTETERALAAAAEEIVRIVSDTPEMKTGHTIASVLRAYEFMRQHTRHWYTPTQAAITVALAADNRGLILWMREGRVAGMATFWPTDNPNIERRRQVPPLNRDGQYVYFDWMLGVDSLRQMRRLTAYAAYAYPKAAFLCCHDNRTRMKGNRRRGKGHLIVKRLRRGSDKLGLVLGLPP